MAPTRRTAFEVFLANVNHPKQLRTNLSSLDTALGGGLHLGAITEIAGVAGVGKTQFAMTVAIQILFDEILVTKEGTSTVIYFDAEATFNVERLLKIGQNFSVVSSTKLLIVDSIAALYVHLRTNLSSLDTALGGGLHLGAITEIAGVAGVGKTQFAMTVAIQILFDEILVTKEGTSTVIYFDAEATFNVERLEQIAATMLKTRKGFCRDFRTQDLLNRIVIIKLDTLAQFLTKRIVDEKRVLAHEDRTRAQVSKVRFRAEQPHCCMQISERQLSDLCADDKSRCVFYD
ncbi:hypothetical protein ABG067_001445 [Albugo candida]